MCNYLAYHHLLYLYTAVKFKIPYKLLPSLLPSFPVSGGSGMHSMEPPIASFSDVFSLLSRSEDSLGATNNTDSVFLEKLDKKKTSAILRNIEQSEWVEPTPIQVKSSKRMVDVIPWIINQNKPALLYILYHETTKSLLFCHH